MNVELTDLSPVKKKLSIEVAVDEVERETREVLRRYRGQARIPGFRKGKAPLEMVQKRFSKEVEEDVRERIVSRCFLEAAKEKGLRPLGNPALDDLSHEQGRPLRFQATFEVFPEIELKGHKDVEVRRPSVRVADAEVDRALEEIRESRVQLVTDEGREATTGDVIVADVEGTPEDEGEPFRRERMQIEIGGTHNLPAFNDALLGARGGAELDFSVEYPKEYQAEQLAGKTVRFRVKVHEVKRRELPELDDELAKDLGEFEDLAALRARVRQDLEARKQADADHAVRHAVLDKVLLANAVVLPEVLVESEIRKRLEQLVRNMMMQGMDPEKMDLDWKELRQRQEEPARKAVHADLLLDTVARVESIEVDNKAVEERIRNEALRMGEEPARLRQRLRERGGIEALKSQLVRDKSLDYLTSVANIQIEE